MTFQLHTLGWTPYLEEHFAAYEAEGFTVGRVALEHKHLYRIYTQHGEQMTDLLAEVTGKLRYQAYGREDYPAVGDWVVIAPRHEEKRASIHAILPRMSKFSRKVAGDTVEEQIVATNVNTVFLVTALNQDFNVRRIERYLILAWESGATPVILLSKADLCDDVEDKVREVQSVALGVPIHVISSLEKQGLDELAPYVREGQTVALLGSSGVGKSTLINALHGQDIMATGGIREGDDRGKHTTTHRELVLLPNGGILIDTPGMRELQLWDADEGLSDSFRDIEEFASQCQFRDCEHHREPGCAVREALRDGSLDQSRYDNYVKLQRELAYLARKEDKAAQSKEKDKWKKIAQGHKQNAKMHAKNRGRY